MVPGGFDILTGMIKHEGKPVTHFEPTREDLKGREMLGLEMAMEKARRVIAGISSEKESVYADRVFMDLHRQLAETQAVVPDLSSFEPEAMNLLGKLPAAEISNIINRAERYERNGQKDKAKEWSGQIEERIAWWRDLVVFDHAALGELRQRAAALKEKLGQS